MPRHRSRATPASRRRTLIATTVALAALLVAGLLVAWPRGDDRAAGGCDRAATLKVAVAPSAEQPVREAANRWNAARTEVTGHCVKVNVSSVESTDALSGLTGEWSVQAFGDRPQAWLPESSLWTDRLSAADQELLASAPESVASSPVVLAAPEEAAGLLTGSTTFAWGDLGSIVSDTSGWTRFGRPTWGRLTIAMPAPATNPATSLAIQAALVGVAKRSPLTTQLLAEPAVAGTLDAMAAAQPADVPDTGRGAMAVLGDVISMETAPYSAVPVLEVDLYRRNLAADRRPAGRRPLFEIAPTGQTPSADFPYVTLSGTDPVVAAASDRFRQFLADPAARTAFARAGLRTAGGEPPPQLLGLSWPEMQMPAAPADRNTSQQLAATWSNAVGGGQAVTLVVALSGAETTLDEVKEALHGYADYTVSGSLGLWRPDDRAEQLVPTGPIADQRPAMHAAVDRLTLGGAGELYKTIAEAYRSAADGYADGKANRVVVITDAGGKGSMTLAQLKSRLKSTKPLPVHVIAIGSQAGRAEFRDLAKATGGSVSALTDAEGVRAALGQLASAPG